MSYYKKLTPNEPKNIGGRPSDPKTADGHLMEILKDIHKITRLSRQNVERTAAKIEKRLREMDQQNGLGLTDMLEVLSAYSKIPGPTGSMVAPLAKIINDLRQPAGSGSKAEVTEDTWKKELIGSQD